MLTNTKILWACLPMAVLALSGCRQDMHDQPKYKPLGETRFFPDGRESRPNLANTVARGDLHDGDPEFYTGKLPAPAKPATVTVATTSVPNYKDDVDVFPITVDKDLIERGHQRFDVFCSPCHGRLGNGLGMIVRRGFKQPPSYHIDRLRNAPVGHYFDVITNGYGAMYNYAAQITPRDRWAIISYIRVLQYSENQKADQLTAEAKAKLPAKPNPDEEPMYPELPSGPQLPTSGMTPAPTKAAVKGTKMGAMNK